MKSVKLKVVFAGAALVGLMMSGSALAADNVTVTVNATIIGVCKFFPVAPIINITNTGTGSNIDPSSATSAVGSTAIVYRCSNGTAPTFTVPATATVTCGACTGTPTMAPTITSSNTGAGTGLGSGKDQTLTVTGTIAQAAFQNSLAGAYTGTMSVTVAP
ncbi:MAG TPA: hypothetical protein VGH59_13915 [Casimicrobiaceae bacterium]